MAPMWLISSKGPSGNASLPSDAKSGFSVAGGTPGVNRGMSRVGGRGGRRRPSARRPQAAAHAASRGPMSLGARTSRHESWKTLTATATPALVHSTVVTPKASASGPASASPAG